MLNDETKAKNFKLFLTKLENVGVNSAKVEEILGDKLLNATFSIIGGSSLSYDGSLIQTVLRTLTPMALKLNELLPEGNRVNIQSIIKVCLLSHLSKCLMFTKNDNQWEVENRGIKYKYAKSDVALKMGAKSILLAQDFDVKFTSDEFEAMMILDKDETDSQSKFYSTPLSVIIKLANELTFLTNKIAQTK